MNKRELIEHINNTLFDNLKDTFFTDPTFSITESAKDNKVAITFETEKVGVLVGGMLKKFEKVTIPQFVADWYEEYKDDFEGELFRCVDLITRDFEDGDLSEFEEWFIDGKTKPFQTLVNMHQFGYEVEKEKRYTVKMRTTNQPLFYNSLEKRLFFSLGKLATQFTFKQLEEAGFREVFNSPLFEVEEVEE